MAAAALPCKRRYPRQSTSMLLLFRCKRQGAMVVVPVFLRCDSDAYSSRRLLSDFHLLSQLYYPSPAAKVVDAAATPSVSAASSCRHRNQEGGWVLFAIRARVGGCISAVGVLPVVCVLCVVYLGRKWKRMPTMAAGHGGCHLLPPQATIRWLCVLILFSVVREFVSQQLGSSLRDFSTCGIVFSGLQQCEVLVFKGRSRLDRSASHYVFHTRDLWDYTLIWFYDKML
ncbi:uncharacterized protein LOC128133184 [Lactuca sativa]|uniref:uncharacterized protein LOC128133184 n=1 Tax=Lactuca sativa TaxID=4236 RepID=UPI0022AE6BEC|nr:uncharacterized protein LOC128133184 [Lactuca sativa]